MVSIADTRPSGRVRAPVAPTASGHRHAAPPTSSAMVRLRSPAMPIPTEGRSAADVSADLEAYAGVDADIDGGRIFGLVFHAGEDVDDVVRQAHDRYVFHNALNPDVLPSLRRLAAEVVDASTWLHVGRRRRRRARRARRAHRLRDLGRHGVVPHGGQDGQGPGSPGRAGSSTRNVVLPASAHAAFDKGCEYFGLEPRRIPVRADWRCDVDAMADACDDDTVLVVASAPQYPQGVIDPVADVAALAVERDVNCHVDACMGGFTLPVPRGRRAARPRARPVGLPGAGGDDDLRRRAQVRLRTRRGSR